MLMKVVLNIHDREAFVMEMLESLKEYVDIENISDASEFAEPEVAYTTKSNSEQAKLTESQKQLLEMSLEDIENGRVVSNDEVFEKARKWLEKR